MFARAALFAHIQQTLFNVETIEPSGHFMMSLQGHPRPRRLEPHHGACPLRPESDRSVIIIQSVVCQAVGMRSVAWGRSFFVVDAKLMALSRCARRSRICTISYCIPGY